MNVFLTSIMHKDTANNFSSVEKNFELTARSVCSQTDQNFLLVVVCCSVPNLQFTHENIIYHVVDFPAVKKVDGIESKRYDKATKLISGLLFIKQYQPNYVVIIDADDWVSSQLNKHLVDEPDCTGWYISSGYIVDVNGKKSQKKHGLQRFCGSTFSTNYNTLMQKIELPLELDENAPQDVIKATVSRDILMDLINAHGYICFMRKFGLQYKRVPFYALAWIRNTGDNNLSDGEFSGGLSLSPRILAKFGLQCNVVCKPNCDSMLSKIKHSIVELASYLGARMS